MFALSYSVPKVKSRESYFLMTNKHTHNPIFTMTNHIIKPVPKGAVLLLLISLASGALQLSTAAPSDTTDKQVTPTLLAEQSPTIRSLMKKYSEMPAGVKYGVRMFVNGLVEQYGELSPHQLALLNQEVKYLGRTVSKKWHAQEHARIMEKFSATLAYIRQQRGFDKGYCLLVNAAAKAQGGQKLYIVALQTEEIYEVPCSTAWRGIGFVPDSYTTPVGLFHITQGKKKWGESNTILGEPSDIFKKLEHQTWLGVAKWLYRHNTKLEKAYILSNQLALKGLNEANDSIPLTALRDYSDLDSSYAFIDNRNSAKRHIYIHGTNRLDQLGLPLSGGCVRVSNCVSYILGNMLQVQQEIPVFIDYVKFREGSNHTEIDTETFFSDLEDFEQVEEAYSGLLQYDFTRTANIKNKLDRLIERAGNELVANPKSNIRIYLETSMPLPEKALRDWLNYKDSLPALNQKVYSHYFDLNGRYFNTEAAHDSALHVGISKTNLDTLINHRLNFAERYIRYALEMRLKSREMGKKQLEKRVSFNRAFATDSTYQAIGYSLDPERKRVIYFLEMIDSLASNHPRYFQSVPIFQWISSYVDQPRQAFGRAAGGRDYLDVVTYSEALLAQAYLMAIGEKKMQRLAVWNGEIPDSEDRAFYEIYDIQDPGLWLQLDEKGIQEIFKFSRSDRSRIDAKFLIGSLKQNNQRILGILTVAEEYYSQYKKNANKLVVKYTVNEVHKKLSFQ